MKLEKPEKIQVKKPETMAEEESKFLEGEIALLELKAFEPLA